MIFRLFFVKNLDDYDDLDLRGLEKISTMLISKKDLSKIKFKIKQQDWAGLSGLINFKKYLN